MTDLTCRALIEEFLSDYVEGRLPAEAAAALEAHLSVCGDCVAYLENYRSTMKAAKSSGHSTPQNIPERLVQAILAARPG